MMLRASSEIEGNAADLHAVTEGEAATADIEGGSELVRLVEGSLQPELADQLSARRQEVIDKLGEQALVDAAAVVGNFQRMTRIADGTGIPLDDMMMALTANFREELGLNRFGSASYSREPGRLKKLLVQLLTPLMLRRMRKGFAEVPEDG